MSAIIYCLLASIALIYLARLPLAWAMQQEGQGYDNALPRQQQARLSGFGARALAAHQNSIEAFPVFAVGVLIALQVEVEQALILRLCLLHLACRLLFLLCYWLDWASARSAVWVLGLFFSLTLYAAALMA